VVSRQILGSRTPRGHGSCEFVLIKDTASQPAWSQFATDLDALLPRPNPYRFAELDQLVTLIRISRGVMSEALQERHQPVKYFQAIFMCIPGRHRQHGPWSEIAQHIGQFPGDALQDALQSPAPSQYSARWLRGRSMCRAMPAFPSGHATETFLIAMCLSR